MIKLIVQIRELLVLLFNQDNVKSRYYYKFRGSLILTLLLIMVLFFLLNWYFCIFIFVLFFILNYYYFLEKTIIKVKVDIELTRAGLYQTKLNENTVLTPDIEVKINKESPFLEISFFSNLKYHKKLSQVDFGAVLNYTQVDKYQDFKTNKIVYILEKKIDRRLYFSDEFEFDEYFKLYTNENILKIDKMTTIPITHMFLVGATGSGKTVALTYLIKQLITKRNEPKILIFDRKKSDLYLLSKKIKRIYPKIFYDNRIDGILENLGKVYNEIDQRRNNMANLIQQNKKYRPLIVIIDEYISLFQTLKKKDQDELKRIITEILVVGRELNVYLWIAQQSPTVESSGLSTYLKNQFQINIYLRPAMTNKVAIDTLFGKDVFQNVFISSFSVGEGYLQNLILDENNRTTTPKIISFPTPFN